MADGSVTCSRMRHNVFALQVVLSSTSLGSRPSAVTMLSLPIAVRRGQRASAAFLPPGNEVTCPAVISFCSSSFNNLGSRSARVQLPVQCLSWTLSKESSARSRGRCCHWWLDGKSSNMPAWTPSSSAGSAMSGSCMCSQASWRGACGISLPLPVAVLR